MIVILQRNGLQPDHYDDDDDDDDDDGDYKADRLLFI